MRCFLILFLLCSLRSYADTDSSLLNKFIFYNSNDKETGLEDFIWYRLKDLKKEGDRYPFTGYYPGGQLYVYGFYSSLDSGGIKDGFFVYYDSATGMVKSEGLFLNNKREGNWKHYYKNAEQVWYEATYSDNKPQELVSYYRNGQRKREENLSDEAASNGKCYDSLGRIMQFTPFFENPQFPGGNHLVSRYLSRYLVYPDYCKDSGIQGRVLLRFYVDEMGEISEVTVIESVHPALDKSAAMAILSMPNWKPGLMDDEPTKTYFTLPITFKIEY